MTAAKDNTPKPWEKFDKDLEKSASAVPTEESAAIDAALELQLISIRLPKSLIEQLKLIARFNHIGYQPLVRDVLLRFARSELLNLVAQVRESQKAEVELKDADSPGSKVLRAGREESRLWVIKGWKPTFSSNAASVLERTGLHIEVFYRGITLLPPGIHQSLFWARPPFPRNVWRLAFLRPIDRRHASARPLWTMPMTDIQKDVNQSKALARDVLLAITRAATTSLSRFADWLMLALGAAFTAIVARWSDVTNFVGVATLKWVVGLFAAALAFGVAARYVRLMIENGIAAIAVMRSARFDNIDLAVFCNWFRKGLLGPIRWLSDLAKLDPDTLAEGRVAKLSQVHNVFIFLEAACAVIALFVMAAGFNT